MSAPLVSRVVSFDNATPEELAKLFCAMCGDEQAVFFNMVGTIAATWPGAGFDLQALDIGKHLDTAGRSVVQSLYEHMWSDRES